MINTSSNQASYSDDGSVIDFDFNAAIFGAAFCRII
tara:strand:+ start:1344 stop:1451 length:108 start_codon:yes stop_codon:yes gene_type:complete